ncbi:hypothetical protein [Psychroserpens sp. MEBiC05023]
MKRIILLLGIVSILFSIYFFLEMYDIFQDIFKRGFFKTNKGDLLKPTLLLVLGIFLIWPALKKSKNDEN